MTYIWYTKHISKIQKYFIRQVDQNQDYILDLVAEPNNKGWMHWESKKHDYIIIDSIVWTGDLWDVVDLSARPVRIIVDYDDADRCKHEANVRGFLDTRVSISKIYW